MIRNLTAILLAILLLPVLARAAEPETESLDLGNNITLDVITLRAGTFTMGSPKAEKNRHADEEQIETKIAADFQIGKFPVTRGQFAQFIAETKYKTEAEDGKSGGFGWDGIQLSQQKNFTWKTPGFDQTDNHPAVMITFKDAKAFCAWLSKKTGRSVTLPTEAQWEFACRGGTNTAYYNADDDQNLNDIAWTSNNSENATHEVGKKKPNALGLYDMCGNVYQWCLDTYGPYRKDGPIEGKLDKERTVLRGGSWLKPPADARSAARYRNTPGSRNADNGFRIVVTPKPRPKVEALAPISRAHLPLAVITLPALGQETPLFPILFSCFVPLVFLVVVVLIIIALVRAFRNKSPQTPSQPLQQQFRHRLGDDGFWLDTTGYNPGDIINYTYDTPNGSMSAQHVVQIVGPGQFIYTGVRPANLFIPSLIAGDLLTQQNQRRQNIPPIYTPTPTPTPRQERPSSGFPSAY